MSHSMKEEQIERLMSLNDQEEQLWGQWALVRYKLNSMKEELDKDTPSLAVIKRYLDLMKEDALKFIKRVDYTRRDLDEER